MTNKFFAKKANLSGKRDFNKFALNFALLNLTHFY